jgi:hypothetical protein
MQEADIQERAEEERALAEAVRRHAANERGLELERDQLAAQARLPCKCPMRQQRHGLTHAGVFMCLCLFADAPVNNRHNPVLHQQG